jgi:hypothetical protein
VLHWCKWTHLPSPYFEGLSDANCSILYPCCNSLKLCFTPAFCSLQWAERALLLGKHSHNEGSVQHKNSS